MKKIIFLILFLLLSKNIYANNAIDDLFNSTQKLFENVPDFDNLVKSYYKYPSKAIYNLINTCYKESKNLDSCICFTDEVRKTYPYKKLQEIEIQIKRSKASKEDQNKMMKLIEKCK